jgi:ankyrin repeat protein
MIAAFHDHLPILRTLLDRKGIAIDAVNTEHRYTAFHLACLNDHADCAVELARHGCDTTLRTKDGETGKDIAESEKHTAVLEGLRALVAEQLRAKQQATAQPHDPLTATTTALELRAAAENGDCGKLCELLDGDGASAVNERIQVTDATGEKVKVTALLTAVVYEQHAAVELLLEHSANPNLADSDGATPLMEAAIGGHLPILRTLLDRKDIAINDTELEHDATAFHLACGNDKPDCAVELARRGCDMTLRTKDGETGKDIVERMKRTAVLEGLRALVVEQLQTKRQPSDAVNDQQQQESLPVAGTAALQLRLAAQEGDCGKLRELLDGGGASVVDARTEVMDATGEKYETTTLIQAVRYGQHAAVELLLERKANPNLPHTLGSTPLMTAAQFGRLPILQMLLDRQDIVINAVDPRNGGTAFHKAFDWNAADCAVELVRHGCDTELMDYDNETGWDIAKRHGDGALIRRCKGAQKLAVRKTQQQDSRKESPALASASVALAIDTVSPADGDEKQVKAAKKAVANRKKKDRKRAKKAAKQQLLVSQAAAGRELHTDPDPELQLEEQTEPEPELPTKPTELALRKVQQQAIDKEASSARATAADSVPQADKDTEQQNKAAKKTASNRKKKDRKKAKKAAEQQLISQPEPEPEPELDERTQHLQALTELGVQQWSAAQVLEWVTLADLPPESVSAVSAALESLGVEDGEDLLCMNNQQILQKKLAKHGEKNAEALAKQVIEQRDALLLSEDSASESASSPKSELLSDILECPLCMELYCDDEAGMRVPRMLTSCGHTVCHGCIANMLTRVLAEGNAKPYKCPTCSKVTKVSKGKAASLPRNFALAAALEALQ